MTGTRGANTDFERFAVAGEGGGGQNVGNDEDRGAPEGGMFEEMHSVCAPGELSASS